MGCISLRKSKISPETCNNTDDSGKISRSQRPTVELFVVSEERSDLEQSFVPSRNPSMLNHIEKLDFRPLEEY